MRWSLECMLRRTTHRRFFFSYSYESARLRPDSLGLVHFPCTHHLAHRESILLRRVHSTHSGTPFVEESSRPPGRGRLYSACGGSLPRSLIHRRRCQPHAWHNCGRRLGAVALPPLPLGRYLGLSASSPPLARGRAQMKRGREPARASRAHRPHQPSGGGVGLADAFESIRKARPSLPSPPCPIRPSAPFPSFFPQRNCSIQYRANLAKCRAHLA